MSNRDQNIAIENLEKKIEDQRKQLLVMERNILSKLDAIGQGQAVVFNASAWSPVMKLKWWIENKWEKLVAKVKGWFQKKEEVKA